MMHLRTGKPGAVHQPKHQGADMAQFILRLPQVKASTGLSRTSIYEFVKSGTFPRLVALGARAAGWLESSITEWIDGRPTAGQ